MQRHIISVVSVTYALKGRDALRNQGIKAYVQRKTKTNGNTGCGYVIIAEGDRQKISQILLYSKISILDFNSIA